MFDHVGGGSSSTSGLFTAEQEEHFQRRSEEGFNLLTDPDYLEWLRINHSESELLTDYTPAVFLGHDEEDVSTVQSMSQCDNVLGTSTLGIFN